MAHTAAPRHDPLSRALHWLTAIAVTVAFILGPGGFGRLMRQGVDPAARPGIVWHESLGLLVLALTLLRLLWVALRPAKPQFDMLAWMQALSQLVHGALWALLLALPATALLALQRRPPADAAGRRAGGPAAVDRRLAPGRAGRLG